MNIKDYATTSKIPLKTLRAVVRKGFVPETLTDLDLYALKLVENLWLWRDFLRSQMVKLNVKDRKSLIETCKFNTKWERYAYTRMMNLKPEQELPMKRLFQEIEMTFRFQLSLHQEKIIYKIRKSVRNKKQYVNREEKKFQDSMLDWGHNEGGGNDS